jgi:RIO kinase 1
MEIGFEVSDFEQDLLLRALGEFYDDGWFTEVLYRVKGGKEANVYCCRGNPATGHELIAAKVYRPRRLRSMRNYGLYRQGRQITSDKRLLRALKKKTRTGKGAEDWAWIHHEYDAIATVYDLGADVPEPIASGDTALLTAYVGDENRAAPLLHETTLAADAAKDLFVRLMRNVELFLACNLIHGDLSSFNVLYWAGEGKIIDFPQAVDPFDNPSAFSLLARDVERLCQHFAPYGVLANYADLTTDLWERFHRRELVVQA